MDIDYKRHAKARRLSIRVQSSGRVVVTRPYFVSLKEAQKFVLESHDWIVEKIEHVKKFSIQNEIPYQNNHPLQFLGKTIKVNWVQQKVVTHLFEDQLNLYVPTDKSDQKKWIQTKIVNWYMDFGKSILNETAQEFATQLGIIPKSIQIRHFKSRWGSCSSKKEIYLNWQILTLKPELMKYVVAHELCHLVHMNHSSEFYKLLDQLGFEKNKYNKAFREIRLLRF